MAFSDPQSLTIAATPITLPRVAFGQDSGAFKSSDGLVGLSVSSAYGKRNRRTLRVTHSKLAADPYVAGLQGLVSMSCYIVVDAPKNGYTAAQQKEIVDALSAYLTASTGANVTKLLGGEN